MLSSFNFRKLLTAVLVPALVLTLVGCQAVSKRIDDTAVNSAVTMKLDLAPGVEDHLINVETSDGVVMLSGRTDSLLSKEKAAEIAANTKGVRSVVNRIKIPSERGDMQIHQDVLRAVSADPAAEAYDFKIEVNDGEVTLIGTVESLAEKNIAENVVKQVRGVTGISNNIRVQLEEERPEHEILADVKRRIRIDPMIEKDVIQVVVENDTVDLNGSVASLYEKDRIRKLAEVAGVTKVNVEDVKVDWMMRDPSRRKKPPAEITDVEITKAVKDALVYDPRVATYNVKAEVKNGLVTLTGNVPDLTAKRAAEKTAENTLGVTEVKNLIRVRPERVLSDTALTSEIEDAITRNPYVTRRDIEASVDNGKVTLRGEVESYFEKNQAEEAASQVVGVVSVKNNLEVTEDFAWVPDWQIRRRVEDLLFWDPYVPEEQVDVQVDEGTVYLEGEVPTDFQRQRTAVTAWGYGEVRNVDNRIMIQGRAVEP